VQRFPFLFNIIAKGLFPNVCHQSITKSGTKIDFFVLKQKEKKKKKTFCSFNYYMHMPIPFFWWGRTFANSNIDMVFNSFLKSYFFFGKQKKNFGEAFGPAPIASCVKFFLYIRTKQKLAVLFFLQTLMAADTDEHRVLLRNMFGNKSWLSNTDTKKRRFLSRL
jgi:hypothetical protein